MGSCLAGTNCNAKQFVVLIIRPIIKALLSHAYLLLDQTIPLTLKIVTTVTMQMYEN